MRHALLALVLLASLLLASAPASADDWDDARKAFRKASKDPDAQVRASAFTHLFAHDRPETVDEVLPVLRRDASSLVLLGGIKALARLDRAESRQALADAVRSEKGITRLYVLVALAELRGAEGHEVLLEVAQGKDAPAAAQAALALGARKIPESLPVLKGLLASEDWHLRSAGARAIATLAGGGVTVDAKDMLPALVESLGRSEGRERGDLVAALAKVSGQKYGNDLEAWRRLASGTPPSEITAKPVHPPHLVGIPMYGKRIVLLLDNGVRTDDPHPFEDKARLQELCQVPDARPVPWYELRTVRNFATAHLTRVISDLPDRGATFDVIAVGLKAKPAFGKLTGPNAGTRKVAADFLAGLKAETAHDDFTALSLALDLSGKKDSVAWSLGPDEIAYVTCQGPWLAEVADAMEVATAIGLKARLRMVPIHTVGVGEHPHEMLRALSELSGGTYLGLAK